MPPVRTYRLGCLIMVGEPLAVAPAESGQVVVYVRVSSADQRADLDRQVARTTTWATGQRLAVSRVVTEVGSALNGHRKKFLGLLRDPQGRRLLVVDPAEVDDDLVRDVIEILRSLCARRYGRRAAASRARRTAEAAGQPVWVRPVDGPDVLRVDVDVDAGRAALRWLPDRSHAVGLDPDMSISVLESPAQRTAQAGIAASHGRGVVGVPGPHGGPDLTGAG